MIDLYVDETEFTQIIDKDNEHILYFKNGKKDESIEIVLDDKRMLDILFKLERRCETLGLIYPADIKLKE